MKTASIPSLRVAPELRAAAEEVLQEGETLSSFVEESVRRNVEYRRLQRVFLQRGLASAESTRITGKYVPAQSVLSKLSQRLEQARAIGSRKSGKSRVK